MRFGVDRDKDIAVLARRVADLEARLGKDGSG
jgi:hypothetical protein